VADGWALPEYPDEIIRAGRFAPVPLLLGGTSDEGSYWTRRGPLPIRTIGQYRAALRASYGALGDSVFARYPATEAGGLIEPLTRFLSDEALFGIQLLARSAAARHPRTYLYEFARVNPGNRARGWGAPHGVELPYLFGRIAPDDGRFDPTDRTLSESLLAYWTQFVKTGNPNRPGLVRWEPYGPGESYLIFGDTISSGRQPRTATMKFLERLFRPD
jgi:para-nitrobenzyl esterase